MKAKIGFLLFIVGQLCLYGCATAKGPLFAEIPLEHSGKALVYFYRNSHTNSLFTFDLIINGRNTLLLPNKGYHLLILDPGAYNFVVSHMSVLQAESRFDLQGNEVYYIRYHVDVVGYDPGLFGSNPIVRRGITSVPRDKAMEVLKECRLIGEIRK